MDIRKNLRRAGDFLAKKDDQYSQLISDQYDRLPDNGIGRAIKGFGHTLGGGMPSFRGPLQPQAGDPAFTGMERVVANAVPAINAVPKYVLPATAAGVGLSAMTNAFMAQTGGPADMQEPGQLDLNPLETVAVAGLLGGGFGAANSAAYHLGVQDAEDEASDPNKRGFDEILKQYPSGDIADEEYESPYRMSEDEIYRTDPSTGERYRRGGQRDVPAPDRSEFRRLAGSPVATALLMPSKGAPDSRKFDYDRREYGSARRPFNAR